MTRRRRNLLVATLALPVLLAVGLGIWLATADLGRFRGRAERLASDALGRRVSIAGRFEPRLSLHPGLIAEGVSLANASWSDGPAMVRVDRLSVTIDLLSLLRGPLRVEGLSLRGVQVLLEVDPAAGPNWELDAKTARQSPGKPFDLVLDRGELRDATIVYVDRAGGERIETVIDALELSVGETGRVELQAAGTAFDEPFEIAGGIGPLAQLLSGEAIDHRLEARLGDISLKSEGSVASLRGFGGPDLSLEIRGRDLGRLTSRLGRGSLGDGPFHATLEATPDRTGADAPTAIVAEVELGGLRLEARGTADRLLPPERFDVVVSGSGPELRELGRLIGLPELPAGAFTVDGRARDEGGGWSLEDVRIAAGGARVTAAGHLGAPPGMSGTALDVEAEGNDLSAFSEIARWRLPAAPFRVAGRLTVEDGALGLEGVRGTLGPDELAVDGRIVTRPGIAGSELTVAAEGPDAAILGAALHVRVPAQPFTLRGGYARGPDRSTLRDVRLKVGEVALRADGVLGDPPGFVGSALEVDASGPDLSALSDLAGRDLPAESFAVRGRVAWRDEAWTLDRVALRLGAVSAEADGTLGQPATLDGTDLALRASGPDLRALVGLFDAQASRRLPAEPFGVDGRVRIAGGGYETSGLALRVGGLEGTVAGSAGAWPELRGLEARVTLRDASLDTLQAWIELPALPDGALAVSGAVRERGGAYEVDDLEIVLGRDRLLVDGALGRLPEIAGVAAGVELDVADLSAYSTAAGRELPASPLRLRATIQGDGPQLALESLEAAMSGMTLRAVGRLGLEQGLHGTELRIDAFGDDATQLSPIVELSLPAGSFAVRGGVAVEPEQIRFDALELTLDGSRLRLDGSLGATTELTGTALDAEGSGPDLGWLATLLDGRHVPAGSWELRGHLDGDSGAVELSDFEIRVGDSDLSGSLRFDRRGRPRLDGAFTSRNLGLAAFAAPDAAADTTPTGEKQTKYVFQDTPLDLAFLDELDARILLQGGSGTFLTARWKSLDIAVELEGGRLRVEPLTVVGPDGGSLSGSLEIEPVPEGHRFALRLDAADVRLGLLSGTDDTARRSPLAGSIALEGRGRSWREIAGGANGSLQVLQGPGEIRNDALSLLSRDILLNLLTTLNPFARDEPATHVECGVYLAHVEQGLGSVETIALRTDTVTIRGHGTIDLRTEVLDLAWNAKPRKGLGLSASTITNSYIKLGGTLAAPSIELKPLEAAVTTGAAVATVGLSFLAKGLWDRATSEKDVCKQAMKELERAERDRGPD